MGKLTGVTSLSGGRYRLRVEIHGTAHKKIVGPLDGVRSIRAAARWRDAWIQRLRDPRSHETLATYFPRWIRRSPRTGRAETTVKTYARITHRWLLDQLGDVPMLDLDLPTAALFLAELAETQVDDPRCRNGRLSTSTLVTIQNALKALVKDWWRETAQPSPLYRWEVPKKPTGEITARTGQDQPVDLSSLAKLLEVCLERGDLQTRAAVLIMVAGGLRIGEAVGLNRADLFEFEGEILIKRTGRPDGSLGPPKGKKTRPAPLPALVRDAVCGWLAERDKCLVPDEAPEALFIDSHGRRMRTGSLRYRIQQMAKAADVELVPHQLRHTFVTEAKRRRMDPSLLRTIVGHTREQTTGIYTHLGGADAAREASAITRRVLGVAGDCVKAND